MHLGLKVCEEEDKLSIWSAAMPPNGAEEPSWVRATSTNNVFDNEGTYRGKMVQDECNGFKFAELLHTYVFRCIQMDSLTSNIQELAISKKNEH